MFNVIQLKRIGKSYKQFYRWLRQAENDDYYNEHVMITNPYHIKLTEKERKCFLDQQMHANKGNMKHNLQMDGH